MLLKRQELSANHCGQVFQLSVIDIPDMMTELLYNGKLKGICYVE